MRLFLTFLCFTAVTFAISPRDAIRGESRDLDLIKNLSEDIRHFAQKVTDRKDAFLKTQPAIFKDAEERAVGILLGLLQSSPAQNGFDELKCKKLINMTTNEAFNKLLQRPYKMCQFHSDHYYQSLTRARSANKLRMMESDLVTKDKAFSIDEVRAIRNEFNGKMSSYDSTVKEMESWIQHCTELNKKNAEEFTIPWTVFVELFKANCISEFCTPYTKYCLRNRNDLSRTTSSQELAEQLFGLVLNIEKEINEIDNITKGDIYDSVKEQEVRNVVEGLIKKSEDENVLSNCRMSANRSTQESINVARQFMKGCYLTSRMNLQRQRQNVYKTYQALENQNVNNIDDVINAYNEYKLHKTYHIQQCLHEATERMNHHIREVTFTFLSSCLGNFCTTPFNNYCLEYNL